MMCSRAGMAARMAAVVSVSGLAASAFGGPVEVIYCKKGGDPKAAVAGWLDLAGAPLAVEVKAINDIVVSADGSRWVLRAQTTAPTTHDVGVIYGTGTAGAAFAADGTTFIEAQPSPASSGTAAFLDFITTTGFANWDSNNNMVLGTRWRTTQTGSTTSSDGFRCFRIDATSGAVDLVFRATDPYTGLQGGTTGPLVGTSTTNVHLLDDGRVGLHDTNATGISSLNRPIAAYATWPRPNPAVDFIHGFQQKGAVPAGQSPILDIDGITPLTWDNISTDFHTTPDGQHWYLHGRVTSSTGPSVFVVNGLTRLKTTVEIGTSGVIPTSFLQAVLTANGDWYVRGAWSGGQYIVKNGEVIAKSGDPIFDGSAETWGATFSGVAANANGDFIILGPTSASAEANDVVVLNRTTVLLREGDAVDLDGNGQFDDDAFIGRGNNTLTAFTANAWALSSGGVVHGVIMLRDGQGNDINSTVSPPFGTPQAFIRMSTGGQPCYANCDGSTVAPVLNVADFGCFLSKFAAGDGYANCDGSTIPPVLNVADFGCFLQKFAAGCR